MKKLVILFSAVLFCTISHAELNITTKGVIAQEPTIASPTIPIPAISRLSSSKRTASYVTAPATGIEANYAAKHLHTTSTRIVGNSVVPIVQSSSPVSSQLAGRINTKAVPVSGAATSGLFTTAANELSTPAILLGNESDDDDDDEGEIAPPTPHGDIKVMGVGSGMIPLLLLIGFYTILKFLQLRREK